MVDEIEPRDGVAFLGVDGALGVGPDSVGLVDLLLLVEDQVGLLFEVFHLHLLHVHQVQLVELPVPDLRRPRLLLDRLDFLGEELDQNVVVCLALLRKNLHLTDLLPESALESFDDTEGEDEEVAFF